MKSVQSGDLEVDEEAAERQPLLPPKERSPNAVEDRIQNLWRSPVVDNMTYKIDSLVGWSVFVPQGTKIAWSSSSAWLMLLKLSCLSIVVAVLVAVLVPDPAQTKTSKFQKISVFLRILVGLLLGFFVSSSVNRWFQCANGFLQLFDAIRNLQMQLLAMGVPKDLKFKCVRYGVISIFLLARTQEIEAMQVEERSSAIERMWAELVDDDDDQEPTTRSDVVTQRFLALTRSEADMLMTYEDPTGIVWIWVASLVARMAQDGWIPPMASPTYGRIMNLAQAANSGIRTVKLAVLVQAPFIYVHMLATLVHVNNIFNAISFGITMGSTIGTGLQVIGGEHGVYSHQAKYKDIIADAENLFISFVISLIGPFLYQVLLEVSLAIAQPFSSGDGQFPTGRLLDGLQRDLSDAIKAGEAPPSWKAPFLKAPAPPSVEVPLTSANKQP